MPLEVRRAALGARQIIVSARAIVRGQLAVVEHAAQIGLRLLVGTEPIIEDADLNPDARQVGIEDQQPLERP